MNITATRITTQVRTWALIAGLSALIVVVGGQFVGGASGYLLFALIAVVMNLGLYWFSAPMALRASKAQPAAENEYPQLHEIVRDLSARAHVPVPKLYIVPSYQPNAFATGRNPKHSAVAVTQGLLRYLPSDEVRGVLAHEFAHIKNRDILVSSIAAGLGAIITGIAYALQFGMLFGGEDDDGPLGIVGALAMIILAPLAATILQLAVSRQREYLADATGASFIGDPNPLANALETLERGTAAIPLPVNASVASLYIANPLSKQGVSGLFSTHPPMEERIRRLRALSVG
ncbi:MAG: zinc metalloprotease HtpX [Gaiellales bacterium]